jgi:hypothetical protein
MKLSLSLQKININYRKEKKKKKKKTGNNSFKTRGVLELPSEDCDTKRSNT